VSDIRRITSDDSATARMEAARKSRNRLVYERNLWMAVVSRLFPSHITPATQRGNHPDTFAHIVCIHTPAGQIATRISKDDLPMFEHLTKDRVSDWDRHTYFDKITRLERLASEPAKSRQRVRRS